MQTDNLEIKCPVCGANLIKTSWGYGCSKYQDGCKFSIGAICGKQLTEKQVAILIESGHIGPISGFKSKAGNTFTASLKLVQNETGSAYPYKIEFEFPESDNQSNTHEDVKVVCPMCSGNIKQGRYGWVCEKECGVSIPYQICGKELDAKIATELLSGSKTEKMDGFISKKKKPFSAALYLDEDGKLKFDF